jgi:aminoglycoside/choline kinase family phosphotransferase
MKSENEISVVNWATNIVRDNVNIEKILEGNSRRQNYRVYNQKCSYIIYCAKNIKDYIALSNINQHLWLHGVSVPRIIGQDENLLFVMVEDLGKTSAEQSCQLSDKTNIILDAAKELAKIHTFCLYKFNSAWCNNYATLNYNVWYRERFGQFFKLLVEGYLKYGKLPYGLEADLKNFESLLEWKACCHTIIHGDWHFRNLMICHGKVFVIDWIGVSSGPIASDLASFFVHPYNSQNSVMRKKILQTYLHILCLSERKKEQLYRKLPMFELAERLRTLALFAVRARNKHPERAQYVPPLIEGVINFSSEDFMYDFPVLRKFILHIADMLQNENWDI